MVAFGNPVNGIIAPRGATPAPGQFVVTSTFAEHVASGRGPGIDIGDGKCGSPLIAMCNGIVSKVFTDPNGARVVRYISDRYPDCEPAIAHMPSFEVVLHQKLTEGQVIGHVGSSGATACHCHGGMKRLINGVWVEVDWWNLLRQNGAKEDFEMLKGTFVGLVTNRRAKIASSPSANFRDGVTTSDPILQQYPTGLPVHPVVQVNGQVVAGEATWYGCWLYVDAQHHYVFGYLHGSTLSPLVADEPTTVNGYTKAQVDSMVLSATAPLNTQIAGLNGKIAKATKDLTA